MQKTFEEQMEIFEKNFIPNKFRNSLCISASKLIDKEVVVAGWLSNKRDHGKVVFLEIRDESTTLQVIVENNTEESAKFPLESVLQIKGKIRKRDDHNVNEAHVTGNVELVSEEIKVLSKASNLPFLVDSEISEELSYNHRTLYLRFEKIQKMLNLRSEMIKEIINFMTEKGFKYVHTPILTMSPPEGSREFKVPSRLHPGKFYTLPQSPQVFKQLLMVGGVGKYFQIAPCFRDEDARADRCYGEFYQLDIELSFVEQENVLQLITEITKHLLEKFDSRPIKISRISYQEAEEIYGTDKPDFRNPLILEDFTEVFKKTQMEIFTKQIANGAIVKGIRVKNPGYTKQKLEQVLSFTKLFGFNTAYIERTEGEFKGPISKYLSKDVCNEGEVIFFVCDQRKKCLQNSSVLRNHLGNFFELIRRENHIVIVKDFPMFEKDDEDNWTFCHNPFSKPQNLEGNEDNLEVVKAFQYDLVLNGFELFSGSIRNDNLDDLTKVFKLCGYTEEEFQEKFRAMLSSFKLGVPPHGGAAMGLERLLMIILDEKSVREVCAFPMNTKGVDPMVGAPGEITEKQLKEIHIKINKNN